jgi:hypothetical protein
MGVGGTKPESAYTALQKPLRAEDGREFAAEKNAAEKRAGRQPGFQKTSAKEKNVAAYAFF